MSRRRSTRAASRHEPYLDSTCRPLQSLAFLLPLVAVYEIGLILAHPLLDADHLPGLTAQHLLRAFFLIFGATGYYLPGFVLIALLLVQHAWRRDPWRVQFRDLPVMAAESLLWAVPLLFVNHAAPLPVLTGGTITGRMVDDILLSIGAGLYEELVFRLIVMSVVLTMAGDLARWRDRRRGRGRMGMRGYAHSPGLWNSAAAVAVSALLFSLHHFQPIGLEPFALDDFAFRCLAGIYLSVIFLRRGFGIAVGAHAAYDVIVVLFAQQSGA